MAFINEYIPKEDLEKYNFEELNKKNKQRHIAGTSPSRAWTIDREADIWLRSFGTESDHTAPDGGYTGFSYWDFYWKGTLMFLEIQLLETGGNRGEHCWSRKKLTNIEIPINLKEQRPKILKDLETALMAYKDGGVYSSSSSYTLTLEI